MSNEEIESHEEKCTNCCAAKILEVVGIKDGRMGENY